jgi:hypothetical protein
MATNFLEFSRFFSIRVENCRKSSIGWARGGGGNSGTKKFLPPKSYILGPDSYQMIL